jgi:INO80 complex subunit C
VSRELSLCWCDIQLAISLILTYTAFDISKYNMAPSTPEADAHQQLIDQLDIHSIRKPFRNPHWKPNQRRNKNIKTILGDAVRKEASLMPTQDNSGAATPLPDDSETSTGGETTPAVSSPSSTLQPNLAQASRNLSKLVLERNMRSNGFSTAPNATYTNIESAPSLAHPKHYCDITGLSAPYTDPKTRLRYHDKEIFGVIRSLGQGVAEQYLEARGAHTVLK